MTRTFKVLAGMEAEHLAQLARLTPLSPFNSGAYAAAASSMRMTPYALVIMDQGKIVDGCLGLLSPGTAARRLELPSLPNLQDPQEFWRGIAEFCAHQQVTDLIVETFASEAARLPDFPRQTNYRRRCEYVIDLVSGYEDRLAKDHRYNIRKAVRNGIGVERTRDIKACGVHLRLMRDSTNRRLARGESVDVPADGTLHAALLEAGAGELFQATDGEKVLSSILVLRGESGAYYHSGGTRPEGMKAGASQFLLFEASQRLAGEGIAAFNLGGADADAEGLRNFKLRFGAREVPLAAADYYMVPNYLRTARRLIRRLRRIPQKLGNGAG